VKLGEIPAPPRRPRKRVGRGLSSGLGKTCGRGSKVQGSRAGSGVRAWFEGGQMPLVRRVPKRGFNNKNFETRTATVNLSRLNIFEAGTEVTPELLRERGLVKGRFERVKILATGEVDRALSVRVHAWSAGAEKKITAAGGSVALPESSGA